MRRNQIIKSPAPIDEPRFTTWPEHEIVRVVHGMVVACELSSRTHHGPHGAASLEEVAFVTKLVEKIEHGAICPDG